MYGFVVLNINRLMWFCMMVLQMSVEAGIKMLSTKFAFEIGNDK